VNVVDSSGWIEYLSGGPNVEFREPVEDTEFLIVPTLSACSRSYRHLVRHLGRNEAWASSQPCAGERSSTSMIAWRWKPPS
jgi:hypothetical protein